MLFKLILLNLEVGALLFYSGPLNARIMNTVKHHF